MIPIVLGQTPRPGIEAGTGRGPSASQPASAAQFAGALSSAVSGSAADRRAVSDRTGSDVSEREIAESEIAGREIPDGEVDVVEVAGGESAGSDIAERTGLPEQRRRDAPGQASSSSTTPGTAATVTGSGAPDSPAAPGTELSPATLASTAVSAVSAVLTGMSVTSGTAQMLASTLSEAQPAPSAASGATLPAPTQPTAEHSTTALPAGASTAGLTAVVHTAALPAGLIAAGLTASRLPGAMAQPGTAAATSPTTADDATLTALDGAPMGAAGADGRSPASTLVDVDAAISATWTASGGQVPAEPGAPTAATETGTTASAPLASTAPAVPSTSVPSTSVPTTGAPATDVPATAPTPATPAPLASQVARPLFTLAAAGAGEHTMTISVTPDDLGPVLVRAHISATGVRMELFAPTEFARDALRLILPELRRDLAGGALPASLDLSSRGQPGDAGTSGRNDRPAADQNDQGSALLGGYGRGDQDRPETAAPTDPWLRAVPGSTDPLESVGAIDSESALGPLRGRIDVLA